MKGKLSKKLVALVASVLTVLAMATAVSACSWFIYQPQEPESLRDM